MNPLTIRADGYGRFTSFDVDLPTGTVAIIGPNGAGKSTLLNAIELALFADGSRDLAPALGPYSDRLEIELTFEHAGERYRVRRGYRQTPGGTGKATVAFEHAVPGYDESDLRAGIALAREGIDPGLYHDIWEPLNAEDAKATNQLIEKTIGLSRRTFGASAFLAQGSAGAFPEASPADRKAMLGEILDPHGLWPSLADRARADAKVAEQAISADSALLVEREAAAAQLPERQKELSLLAERKEAAAAALTLAEATLEEAQAELAGNQAAAERVRTATVVRDQAFQANEKATSDLAAARLADNQTGPARTHLETLERQAGRVAELEQALDAQRRAKAEGDALRERKRLAIDRATQLSAAAHEAKKTVEALDESRAKLFDRLEHLRGSQDGAERCTVCEQLLGTEARAAAITNTEALYESAAAELQVKRAAAEGAKADADEAAAQAASIMLPEPVAVDDLEEPLRQARAVAVAIPTASHNLAELLRRASEIGDLEISVQEAQSDLDAGNAELTVASEGVKNDAQLRRTVDEARATVATRRSTLESAAADHVRAAQTVEQLEAAAHEIVELRARRDARQRDIDVFRLAERAYGRDGIPALIVENAAIPQIEAGANEILEQLPTSDGVTFRVELRTQAANKTNDNIRETLDILVSDPDGVRPFETYSGGERARLNIALRIALARLLARRRGAESRLLAIDELEYLDELGQEKLVDVLRGVAGDFDRVLVVSHAPGVRDSFDASIEIAKVGGVSRIVGAPVPEADAA